MNIDLPILRDSLYVALLLTLLKSQNHPINVKGNPHQVLQLAQFKVTQNMSSYDSVIFHHGCLNSRTAQ